MGKITIKEWPEGERPRERLVKHGAESLSNSELLAIILRTGSRGETVLELANKLIAKYKGNLRNLFSADVNELNKIKGVGTTKAVQIKAVFELVKRINSGSSKKIEISSPQDVSNFLMSKMKFLDKETFVILCLNTRNKLIDSSEIKISVGSLNTNIVDPREIFKVALSKNAASIILAHNHPSGDPEPSDGDIEVTKRIVEAGKLIGIDVTDHVIIGENKFVSLKDRGLI